MEINEEEINLNIQTNTTSSNNNIDNIHSNNVRQLFRIPFISYVITILPLLIIILNVAPIFFYIFTNKNDIDYNLQNNINIRELNNINTTNDFIIPSFTSLNLSNEIKNKQELIDLYSTKYEFISNLTEAKYIGTYSNFELNQNFFNKDTGDVELRFYKTIQNTNIEELIQNNTLKSLFILKDEHYIDKYIKANFTVYFPNDFISSYKDSLTNQTKNTFEIVIPNTTIDYYICEFLSDYTSYQSNNTNVHIIFHNKQLLLKQHNDLMIASQYSRIDIHIKSENFSVDFTTNFDLNTSQQYKVRNFSFIMTILCIIEMYYTSHMLYKVTSNSEVGLNLDLITIGVSLIYKGLICTANFYLAITSSNGMSYEYGIPSLLYFFAFSMYEFRLLFFSWRTRHSELLFTNRNQFKYKLLVFYFYYYVSLFISLMSMRFIVSNTLCCFCIFTFTWLFQIIHSIKTGTKPPMSLDYIFVISIIRLFFPIYLKAYEGNVFELRPSYGNVIIICGIVLIEMCILMLQKLYGGKIIIPRCCKALQYNYYRDANHIEEHVAKYQDCVICLESLQEEIKLQEIGKEEIESDIFEEQNTHKHMFIDRIKKMYCIGSCINCINNIFNPINIKKKYMVTPCDHIFHTNCLEKWMEVKNECPYCKRRIPPIE